MTSAVSRLLFLLGLISYQQLITSLLESYYQRVSNTFPTAISNCLISSKIGRFTKQGCLLQCSKIPDCYLACHQDFAPQPKCSLYSAIVSHYWNASSDVKTEKTNLKGKCYSSWYFRGDITQSIIDIQSTPPYIPAYTKDKAVNGYFCSIDESNLFCDDSNPDSWFEAKLDKVYEITNINIKSAYVNDFQNVVIRVGNSSFVQKSSQPSLDESNQGSVVFAEYLQKNAFGQVFLFKPKNPPVYGKYIYISTSYYYLSFGDIKIISYKQH